MSDDIVRRLREFGADLTKEIRDGDHGEDGHLWVLPYQCIEEAADEIERLRQLSGEAGQLRKERDEARRDRCMARAVIRWDIEHPNSPQRSQTTIILLAWQIADEEGWDCFKENTDER